jgi:hypothetical protein
MADLLEAAKAFAEKVQKWPETQEVLSRNNHIIQFVVSEGGFLCMHIQDGKITLTQKEAEKDYWKVMTFEMKEKAVLAMLSGKLTIARAIRQGELQVEYAKRSLVSWFGQIVRLHREKLMNELFEGR